MTWFYTDKGPQSQQGGVAPKPRASLEVVLCRAGSGACSLRERNPGRPSPAHGLSMWPASSHTHSHHTAHHTQVVGPYQCHHPAGFCPPPKAQWGHSTTLLNPNLLTSLCKDSCSLQGPTQPRHYLSANRQLLM